MNPIPRDIVDAVRDRTDIVEVISRYLTLSRRGSGHTGLCPFHQEKSPSFHVQPAKGVFFCFGCNTGGDVFRFLMTIEGLSFGEAVRELAGPAGVTVPERALTVDERERQRSRATLYDVLEEAASFYESELWTRSAGERARVYLEGRGIRHETAREARLGFAPPGWTNLTDHLHRQGFPPNLAVEAGLARTNSQDHVYDAMRDRLVFAIRDERSRVIAFGGRLMEGEGPKYLNTYESPLYEKSSVLYGLEVARTEIQRRDRAIVVEGYFDAIALRQAGWPEAVASCGTALTERHVTRLRRLTRNVVLLLDADAAGQRAAERSLPLFVDAGLIPWRLDLPGSKDPDELVREAGPEAFAAALEKRTPLLEWFIDRRLASHGNLGPAGLEIGAMGKEAALADVAPLAARYDDDALVARIARRIGLREEIVRARIEAASRGRPEGGEAPVLAAASWKASRDLVHLLWLIVHRRDAVGDVIGPLLDDLPLEPAALKDAARRLAAGEPVVAVLQSDDAELTRTLAAIVARTELYTDEQAGMAICQVAARLIAPARQARLAAWTMAADAALRAGDLVGYRAAAEVRKAAGETFERLDRALSTRALTQADRADEVQIAIERLREAVSYVVTAPSERAGGP